MGLGGLAGIYIYIYMYVKYLELQDAHGDGEKTIQLGINSYFPGAGGRILQNDLERIEETSFISEREGGRSRATSQLFGGTEPNLLMTENPRRTIFGASPLRTLSTITPPKTGSNGEMVRSQVEEESKNIEARFDDTEEDTQWREEYKKTSKENSGFLTIHHHSKQENIFESSKHNNRSLASKNHISEPSSINSLIVKNGIEQKRSKRELGKRGIRARPTSNKNKLNISSESDGEINRNLRPPVLSKFNQKPKITKITKIQVEEGEKGLNINPIFADQEGKRENLFMKNSNSIHEGNGLIGHRLMNNACSHDENKDMNIENNKTLNHPNSLPQNSIPKNAIQSRVNQGIIQNKPGVPKHHLENIKTIKICLIGSKKNESATELINTLLEINNLPGNIMYYYVGENYEAIKFADLAYLTKNEIDPKANLYLAFALVRSIYIYIYIYNILDISIVDRVYLNKCKDAERLLRYEDSELINYKTIRNEIHNPESTIYLYYIYIYLYMYRQEIIEGSKVLHLSWKKLS